MAGSSQGGAGDKGPSAGGNKPGGGKSGGKSGGNKPGGGKGPGTGQAAGNKNRQQNKGRSKGKTKTAAGGVKKLPTPTPNPGAKARKSLPSATLNPRRRLQRRAAQKAKNLGAKAGVLPQRTGNRVGNATRKAAGGVSRAAGGSGGGEGQNGALAPLSGDASGGKGVAKAAGAAGAVAGAGAVVAGRTAGMALRWGRRTVRLISKIPYAKLAMVIVAVIVLLVVLIMSFVDAVDDSAAAEWAQRERVLGDTMGAGSSEAGAQVIADNTDIPVPYAAAFLSAAEEHDIHWSLLAGLSKQECDHGRWVGTVEDPRRGCIDDPDDLPDDFDESDFFDEDGHPLPNDTGDRGPMQFRGGTWRGTADNDDLDVSGPPIEDPNAGDGFGVDGDGDGIADPWSILDAVHSAAVMLLYHGDGDAEEGLSEYNPGSSTHEQNVLDYAEEYRDAVSDEEIQQAGEFDLDFTGPGYMGDASCPPDVEPIEETGVSALEQSTAATQQVSAAVVECFGGPPQGSSCFSDDAWRNNEYEHPRGRACDFMVCSGCVPTGDEQAWGDAVAAWLMANADELGVMYVVWYNQSQWHTESSMSAYGACSGRTCSNTEAHYDHVHVSMRLFDDDPPSADCDVAGPASGLCSNN